MSEDKNYISKFEENKHQIFQEELAVIKAGRNGTSESECNVPETQLPEYEKNESNNLKPSADKHKLVGLALSGGGIRSATFNLGFLQALSRQGHLKNVDYLSTVSGGGYIGSSLTTLINSAKNANGLLEVSNFPFSNQRDEEKPETDGQPDMENRSIPGKEKEPVRHLRYYSNYLTCEGNFVDRYFRPVMVMARGVLLNFFMMVPYILMIALLLYLYFFKIPSTVPFMGAEVPVHKYFLNLETFGEALQNRNNSQAAMRNYVIENSVSLSHLPYEERLEILSLTEAHSQTIRALKETVDADNTRFDTETRSVWRLPLILFGLMFLMNLMLLNKLSHTFKQRFWLSKKLCRCFLVPSIVLLLVNIFGFILATWEIPPEVGFISILSFLAPKLLAISQDSPENKKKPWVKLAISIFLLILVPLFLLFLVGVVIKLMIPIPQIGFLLVAAIAGLVFFVSERLININKISLHNFYRDRLSRAYLIGADNGNEEEASEIKGIIKRAASAIKNKIKIIFNRTGPRSTEPDSDSEKKKKAASALFDKIKHIDDLKLWKLSGKILPYHIINCNLNLTKKTPTVEKNRFKGGTYRNGESFIFSRNWCGSEKTGYQKTEKYEEIDSHLNLGTAMAISGAAVNIGMAHSNLPFLRPLLALLNLRLGYWAHRPRKKPNFLERLNTKKWPGSLSVLKEYFGIYPQTGQFINLSDGGHFDNIGVYELLRRRCKYIIVGDAEADPEMRFQALSYIIRLARIDFGIQIEIDISDIRPDPQSGISRNHCAMGVIRYPAVDDLSQETGYLLYCKSSLTGGEPQHLHEYRTKHPTFPHQTTADQWFDEQQFEVYRELGYQVGKRAFRPATFEACRSKLEANFMKLKEFWHTHCPEVENHFTKHGTELNAIITQIKNDKDLAFMDAQMFPEWDELMKGIMLRPDLQLWLPENALHLRKGFYVCNLMIQLMENVYLDLNLDKHFDHPDNRGWMNLFRHWSWAGIFRVTWAVSACTFGVRFQNFCRDRLDLDLGEVFIEDLNQKCSPKTTFPLQTVTNELEMKLSNFLNEYERLILKKVINDKKVFPTRLFSFHLRVRDPLDTSREKSFGFGFALMNEEKIAYFRIQDQVRDMGLGRKSLKKMILNLLDEKKFQLGKIKIDKDALDKYKPETKQGEMDVYDMELQKINADMFMRVLSSVIAEIKENDE